jgi:hypothetical protein
MDGQFFTWEALSAIGGASLLTFYIVQYTKSFVKFSTDIYAVGIAYIVLLAAQFATGASASDWRVYVLTFANSFLVSAAAAQIQNKSLNPPAAKSKEDTTNGAGI